MFSNKVLCQRAIALERNTINKRSSRASILASSVAAGAIMVAVPQALHAQTVTPLVLNALLVEQR